MPFMLKIRWEIRDGQESAFEANQEALCEVMHEHPGVITYHVANPSERVSEWTEVYATDEAFAAHLENEKGRAPLGAVLDASEKVTCECWGDPSDASKKILEGFGTVYRPSGGNSFVVNPLADRASLV